MNFRQFATKNVLRNIRAYFGYFLSSTISAALLFSFTMLVMHPDLNIIILPEHLQQGFKLTSSIAYLFLCFFVFYSVSVFLKSRFKEFGILYILGISKRQIRKMIAIENILISSSAGFFGVLIGLVFSKIFLALSGKLLGIDALGFYFPIKAIVTILIAFILMGIIISIFTTSIIKEDKVLGLLKGTQKPKEQPKSSIILSILSIILLVGGYYFAVTSTMRNISYRIIPVTVVVIIATYFLFSQFSIFIIKVMKSNRNFYMHKTAVLWVSNLLYRVKDNSRMFFLIAITSSVVFTSIGGVTAFWMNKEDEVQKNFPQTFFYSGEKINSNRIDFIEDALKRDGYYYTKDQGTVKFVCPLDNTIALNVISQSTYNNLAKSLGEKEVNIKDNEALLSTPLNNIKRKNILTNNMDIKVIGKLEKRIVPAYYDDVYVISDYDYKKIEGSESVFIAFNVKSYKDTLNICNDYNEKFMDERYSGEYTLLMKAEMLEASKIEYGEVMFLTIFIGIIFFVTTGSFLYNKCYMDVEEDKIKYKKLNKIGLTFKEIKKVSTIEIGVLFLLPYVIAVIHSMFALEALKSAFNINISIAAFIVMGSFLLVQIIYFLIIRGNYLLEVKRSLNNK
ncbi:ABC transporter permease [Clostridium sardiniense]|uniref:ABC transporter permease n=1 Tax=Clostridium sardiniense TaxID=29369 RepID=A0ABS7L1V7_CLOSR|nr:ABC transporter permease [Clostridium sardiniense]MBY0756867.1 ABC transporter permease [Clostridium sardiniense]MDQ0458712.1 putative ABC transport system permease protein [Clostridium sardiniense]